MESPFNIIEHTVPCSHIREYARATATIDAPMHLCVKQYIPLDNINAKRGDATLIATHGSGMPKELYEPLFEEIYLRSKGLNFKIRSIWIADAAHQGMSGVLNENSLGNDPSWFDHSRDLLAMVNHFSEQMIRPIIGVGHSMGGGQLVLASLVHPRLFASLILLEPVFDTSIHKCQGPALARASTFRQDVWASKAEAEATTRRKLKSWDERVFQRWLEFGYRTLPTVVHPDAHVYAKKQTSLPSPTVDVNEWLEKRWADCDDADYHPSIEPRSSATLPVTLTTTKHQEVFSYLRPNFDNIPVASLESPTDNTTTSQPTPMHHSIPDIIGPPNAITPFYRPEPLIAHHFLPHLRPSILYIFGAQSPLATPSLRRAKLARTGVGISGSGGAKLGKVREVVVPLGTHLLPLERVEECAEAAAGWLEEEVEKWRAEEVEMMESWEGKMGREKVTVSGEWVQRIRAML